MTKPGVPWEPTSLTVPRAPRKNTARRISRREFTRRAALAAATAAALPRELFARPETTPPRTEAPCPPAPPATQQAGEEPKLSPESRAEIEARIEAIFRKYGPRLGEEQKVDIKRLARELQKPLEALRAYPLDNANEPATPLKLYPDPQTYQRQSTAPSAAQKGKAD